MLYSIILYYIILCHIILNIILLYHIILYGILILAGKVSAMFFSQPYVWLWSQWQAHVWGWWLNQQAVYHVSRSWHLSTIVNVCYICHGIPAPFKSHGVTAMFQPGLPNLRVPCSEPYWRQWLGLPRRASEEGCRRGKIRGSCPQWYLLVYKYTPVKLE